MHMIYADAQNLGVQSRKLGPISLIRRDLLRSDWSESQWKENQDDVLSTQVAQCDGFP